MNDKLINYANNIVAYDKNFNKEISDFKNELRIILKKINFNVDYSYDYRLDYYNVIILDDDDNVVNSFKTNYSVDCDYEAYEELFKLGFFEYINSLFIKEKLESELENKKDKKSKSKI